MLYTRAPSARLMEVMVSPIFFPSVPLTNPRTLWACQDVACMISVRVAPLTRWTRARTAAVLLPGRTPSGFGWVAFLGALASFLARVLFLVDWGLEGATRRASFADGAFVGAFGSEFSPSGWIRLQIRPAATLALLKPFTGSTPGRLFQISANRKSTRLNSCRGVPVSELRLALERAEPQVRFGKRRLRFPGLL